VKLIKEDYPEELTPFVFQARTYYLAIDRMDDDVSIYFYIRLNS